MPQREEALRLEVLGAPRILLPDGRSVALEGKIAALIAYLALEGAQTRTTLAGLLWPDTLASAARNNLVHLLRRLGTLTATAVVTGQETLALVPILTVDIHEPVLEGEGTLLAGLDFSDQPSLADWLLAQREGMNVRREGALRAKVKDKAEAGQFGDALRLASALLERDVLSEEAHRLVMQLHYHNGNRPAALQAYHRCQDVLRRELDVGPSPETRQLARDITLGALPAPAPAADRVPLDVRRPPVLLGREPAWAHLQDGWGQGQSLLITGAAGSGKTRLATDFLRTRSTHQVLTFDGQPGDQTTPYTSHARHFSHLLATFSDLDLPAWVRQELADLRPSGTPPIPQHRKLPFYAAQAEVVGALAQRGPLVLMYDDLHLMDDLSIEAGAYLLARFQPDPGVRSVMCFQPRRLSRAAAVNLEPLLSSGRATTIELEPLSEGQVGNLLGSLGIPEASRIASEVHALAGGQPQRVLDVVRAMFERDRFDVEAVLEGPPGRMEALLAEPLTGLSSPALQAARAAAVLQRDFSPELVAEVLRCSLLDLADAWEELETAQIVRGEGFLHDWVARGILSQTPEPIRLLLERSAARVRASASGSPGQPSGGGP